MSGDDVPARCQHSGPKQTEEQALQRACNRPAAVRIEATIEGDGEPRVLATTYACAEHMQMSAVMLAVNQVMLAVDQADDPRTVKPPGIVITELPGADEQFNALKRRQPPHSGNPRNN